MRKDIICIVLMILTIAFLGNSLFGPWYSQSIKPSSSGLGQAQAAMGGEADIQSYSFNFYLTKVDLYKNNDVENLWSINYADITEEHSEFTSHLEVFTIALYLIIITTIFAILSFIFSLVSFTNIKLKYKKLGMAFSFLTFIFTVIVALYFIIVFSPDFIEESLIPSMVSAGSKTSSGFGYAYYLVVIATIFSLLSFIILFLTRKSIISRNNQASYSPPKVK